MSPRSRKHSVGLPKGVHRVISRAREYFYYHPGRGTAFAGERVRLPDDPHSPEFYVAYRQAQGIIGEINAGTVNALIDEYLAWEGFGLLADGTQYQYKRAFKIARQAWGELSKDGVQPVHVQQLMDGFAKTPGKANMFLSAMRALSAWARPRGKLPQSMTEGVKPFPIKGGHKPWTPAQLAAIDKVKDQTVRRGLKLYQHTGQRGSDVVRLGWTDIDEGGFALGQKKTGVEVWCPILPELTAEMATWKKLPGPFLKQKSGRPFSRRQFWEIFTDAIDGIDELVGVTLHGLRATAVIRLRREGLSTAQIQDITGMSLPMIERYCRFADKKASGKAALISLEERARNRL